MGKKVDIIILIISRIIINIISIFIKSKDNIWIFGSWYGKNYSDHPRLLFEYMTEHKEDHCIDTLVWISKSRKLHTELKAMGINSVYYTSLRSVYYHIFASNYVYSQSVEVDFNRYFINNSLKTNLWHGFPLKKIGKISQPLEKRTSILHRIVNFLTYREQSFVSYSKLYEETIVKAFALNADNIIEGPSIRTVHKIKHYLKDECELRAELLKEKKARKKIVFYLPTFRDTRVDRFLNASERDVDLFLKNCQSNNVCFVTKGHFANSDNKTLDLDKLINIKDTVDISSVLDLCDVLVTDYSSVYFDFLYYNRPIIFYSYDLDFYCNEDRGLIFDYDEMTPGDKVKDISHLMSAILNNILKDKYTSKRNEIKSIIFENNENLSKFINRVNNRIHH
ncbi:CDP-glycerol glycerophosphotransferase family protein [Vibrio parahaemolyticus]|uniref:CDP-glycerol glycerophosphotransferase family protein n=1 Tax=Vibrio parahaemolyticus TaxID=670 RepID=UPI00226BAE6B|nr:CDP-glycerol glycerophosphotransferase family protein [Vibrio parahaemolyticus]MCX8854935.1 CDP-glycerol glycerophosphotransferase family protein [Vibrio parahaemolyticus]